MAASIDRNPPTLRLRGLHHDTGIVRAPAAVKHGDEVAGKDIQDDVVLLRLPRELLTTIFKHCDYASLQRVSRTCKALRDVVHDPTLDRHLFRQSSCSSSTTSSSFSRWPSTEDIIALRTRVLDRHATYRPVPPASAGGDQSLAYTSAAPRFDLAIRLHPAIEEAIWAVDESWDDVRLVAGSAFPVTFRVARLALRTECATDPPLPSLDLVLRCPAHRECPHDRYFDLPLRPTATAARAISVEDVLSGFIALVQQWRRSLLPPLDDEETFKQRFAHRAGAEGPFVQIHADGTVELAVHLRV
ncbi:hypothetical protein V8E36_009174 [Tilletia maclaganii]